jgi:lipoyl-dependent peroxiredoxin
MAIKIRRTASARWKGTVDAGRGQIELGSGAFKGAYSLRSRVGDEPKTNPEELIGAGHAGCFAMSLANLLSDAGYPPNNVSATAVVNLEETVGGFSVTRIELTAVGDVPNLDSAEFTRLAEEAKATCPISRALAGTEITLDARLETSTVETAS